MTTLQELFDHATRQAAMMFNVRGEVLPMWHAINDDDEHLVIATPWENQEAKQGVVKIMRDLFKEKRVNRYVFICEAWTVATPALRVWPAGGLKDHPDRREILAISAENRDGKQLIGFYYILRPEHAPAKLSPFHTSTATAGRGQLMGMLQ